MIARPIRAAGLLAFGLALAACDGRPAPPGDAEVRAALEAYYRDSATVARWVAPESAADAEAGEPPAGTDRDEAAPAPEREDCPEFAFSFRDGSGEERETRIRIPCEAMAEAEAEIGAALDAMAETMARLSEATKREIRAHLVTGVADAETLGCVPARAKPGFVCDVEVSLRLGESGELTRFVTARFVEGEQGWRALELEEHR